MGATPLCLNQIFEAWSVKEFCLLAQYVWTLDSTEREREIVAAKCTMAWPPIKYIYEACNVCHSFATYLGERDHEKKRKKEKENLQCHDVEYLRHDRKCYSVTMWLHIGFVVFTLMTKA